MNPNHAILTTDQLAALRAIDACTVANAIETFHERLRNEGFADGSIRCQFPASSGIRWSATPPPSRSAAPRRRRPTAIISDRTDWWDYILSCPRRAWSWCRTWPRSIGLGSLAGRGACEHPARAWLRRRGDQWRGARSARGGEPRISIFCRQPFRLARLRSHRRIRHAGGNWRPENPIGRFASRRFARRSIHSARHCRTKFPPVAAQISRRKNRRSDSALPVAGFFAGKTARRHRGEDS